MILVCAAASFAQDLGEIARQERERKKDQPDRATYVYTNDDLRREHILVPEDRERALAAREAATKPATQVAQVPASAAPTTTSVANAAPASASIATRTAPAAIPIATPHASASVATSKVPASTPAMPASGPVASPSSAPQVAAAKSVTPEAKQSPLEAILQLVHEQEISFREAAARKHSREHRPAQTVATEIPAGDGHEPRPARPVEWAPEEKKKAARRETPEYSVPSRALPTASRRPPARLEPVDVGVTDIVTIEPGDSLWKLAKRYLGSGARWRELAALNTQLLNANVLHVGEWICLPEGNLQNVRRILPRARAPAATTRKVAQRIVPGACPGQPGLDRFLVTAEPLDASLRRGLSPGRCTSTP